MGHRLIQVSRGANLSGRRLLDTSSNILICSALANAIGIVMQID